MRTLLAFTSLLLACGNTATAATTVSCTLTVTISGDAGSFTSTECSEYGGVGEAVRTTLAHECESAATDAGSTVVGTFAASPCDRTGSAGGCRSVAGTGTITVWFYNEPDAAVVYTSDGIRLACSSANSAYVAP